jgi:zinc protease
MSVPGRRFVLARSAFAMVAVSALTLAVGCRKSALTTAAFRLDNGLRVELVATPTGDKTALVVLFDVGADHDPKGRSGMAHLVEHLLSTSGRNDPPPRTRTGADYTSYAVEVPPGRLPEEIDDAAQRLAGLTLTEVDLARERPRVLAEIAALQERDAVAAAMTGAAEALHPSRDGGRRGGVAAEIEATTLAEIDAFRRAHYGAPTARLVVAGRFDVEEISKRIRASFAKLPAAKPPQPRPPAGSRVTGTLVMSEAPTAVALAVSIPAPKEPTYPAFLVLAARVARASDPSRSWKADFAPLARPDVLFVSSALAAGQPGEATAARIRDEVSALVTPALAAGEPERALAFLAELGVTPPSVEVCARDPLQAAFATGRRAQLGIDAAAVASAARAVTQDQLTTAARLFDAKSTAAVLAGAKLPSTK